MDIVIKNSNYKPEQTFISQYIDYTGSAVGALRANSIIRNLARLYNEIVKTPSALMKQVESVTGAAISGLGIVRLPAATQSAYADVVQLKQRETEPYPRKAAIAFRSVMDALSAWVNAAALFNPNPAFRGIAAIADFGQDGADLSISWNDYNQALIYEKSATGEVQKVFEHARKYNMLRVAKAVLSFAAGFFALSMLITGVSILPVALSILLSLATTMIAIRRDTFKDEGRYKLVDLSQSYSINPVVFIDQPQDVVKKAAQ